MIIAHSDSHKISHRFYGAVCESDHCAEAVSSFSQTDPRSSSKRTNNIDGWHPRGLCMTCLWRSVAKTEQNCSPENMDPIFELINEVINEDTQFAKGPLELRNQRIYAIKVSSMLMLTALHADDLSSLALMDYSMSLDKHTRSLLRMPIAWLKSSAQLTTSHWS